MILSGITSLEYPTVERTESARPTTPVPSAFTIWFGALSLSVMGKLGLFALILIPGAQPNSLRLPLLVAPMGLDALVVGMLTVWRRRSH